MRMLSMGGAAILGQANGILRTPLTEPYHAGDMVDVLMLADGFAF